MNEINKVDVSPEKAHFLKQIFYVVLDNVIGGLIVCAAKQMSDTFSFLWNYQKMSKEDFRHKAAMFAEKYSEDISNEDLVLKMNHITMVHNANFDR